MEKRKVGIGSPIKLNILLWYRSGAGRLEVYCFQKNQLIIEKDTLLPIRTDFLDPLTSRKIYLKEEKEEIRIYKINFDGVFAVQWMSSFLGDIKGTSCFMVE